MDKAPKSEWKRVTADELQSSIGEGSAPLIVDILPDSVYDERHLPGAVNACVYEMTFLEKIKALIRASPDRQIVVYDQSGGTDSAPEAFARLREGGMVNVAILEGGYDAWCNGSRPVERAAKVLPPIPDGIHQMDLSRSCVEWAGRNLVNKHHGTISLKSGQVEIMGENLVGGEAVLDMTSIQCSDLVDSTMNQLLIQHLKSSDFFDVEKYPEATFHIREAAPIPEAGAGRPNFRIFGELEIKQQPRPLALEATVGRTPDGELVAQGRVDLDRTLWNVRYGSGRFFERLGKHLVNDLIEIQIRIFCPPPQ